MRSNGRKKRDSQSGGREMSTPTREELLDTINDLQMAMQMVEIELTSGYNTLPRRRNLRAAVENCMDWSFCGRKVLERAQYKAEGNA
jgi:hypothetical protein